MNDSAVWKRVRWARGDFLDLMTARFRHRHYAPHTHDEFSIGVCTDGVEVIRYRGERHYAGPGTILVLEPGEPHTGGPATADGFAYRVVYPAVPLLAETVDGQPHFRDPVIQDPWLADVMRRTHRALAGGCDRHEAESRLLGLFATLVERHAQPARATRTPSGRATERMPGAGTASRTDVARIVRAVTTRLSEEMTAPPDLARLAADLGMSRYQVLRCFRAGVGMPPYAWLAQHRVARARGLIEAGRMPAEVAALVGFADQAHLTRWFRRVLGVTPGAFRNSVQDSRTGRR